LVPRARGRTCRVGAASNSWARKEVRFRFGRNSQETAHETTAPGKTSAYKLTLMKKLSQSTKPSKVKERAGDLALAERLYQSLKPVLDELALNQDGIQYYAHSGGFRPVVASTRCNGARPLFQRFRLP
jgi:hypothetical protein